METLTTIDHLCPDIWQEIFQYFNAFEVFHSFIHLTNAANAVLFNEHHHLHLRGLVLDDCAQILPEKMFSQIISLELHEGSSIDNLQLCSELRSLKLIGHSQWIIDLLKKTSHTILKLEQLILTVPGVGLLYNLLASVLPLQSLRRLAIYAEDVEERIQTKTLFLRETKIEQFILHSCSSISWNDFAYMCPQFHNIRFLDITLCHFDKNSYISYSFPRLRSISLRLIEIPFYSILQLVTTTPALMKLRLNGLVNGEGYVINNKWLNLFQICPSLVKVIVSLSLEQDTNSSYNDTIQTILQGINLNLRCLNDDDNGYCGTGTNLRHWWNLSGTILKKHKYIEENYPII